MVIARGRGPARQLMHARKHPQAVQAATLERIVLRNRNTEFGRQHHFSGISGPEDFAHVVPVNDYEAFRPLVARMLQGERNVLCEEAPFMFGTTSGTTGQRKFVPINRSWTQALSRAMRLWLARATRRHPTLWSGRALSFVGAAVEGHVASGLPMGSVSGLTYTRVSRAVKQRYALPLGVSDLTDPETRYQVGARLMLEHSVSLAAIPNATTLLRLAEVGVARSETIVKAIADGDLGVNARNEHDAQVLKALAAECTPNLERARFLDAVRHRRGVLLPRDAWPNLTLIGCWLGGTAGVFAERLAAYYGDVPVRDLGLRATEATMTIALEDGVASGVPLLHDNYYEFLPLSESSHGHPRTLGVHELEVGQAYYILLTTPSGLYRYHISDVVEVVGRYHALPLIRFLHKGPDMLSLMGEKVHAQQLAQASANAQAALRDQSLQSAPVVRVCAIPDSARARYDLLIESDATSLTEFCSRVDAELCQLNSEYQAKRESQRLGPMNPVRMRPGWGLRLQAHEVKKGARDSQYKWSFVRHQWDELSRAETAESDASM